MKRLTVLCILLLGLILRLHNYSIYPQRGASSDEYSYSFLGLSLLTKGYPESWSAFSPYKVRYDLTIRNLYFPMVRPYFDHVPLNGLLVAGWALAWGQDSYEKVDLKTIRLVPIALSLISSILVYVIANRLFGYTTAIWALLIYTTSTIIVMNTRVVFAENLVTPLFLGALYLYDKFSKKITQNSALILGIISGLSFWVKEMGIVVFLTILAFFIIDRVKKNIILLFVGTFVFAVLGYIFYGFYFGKDVFLAIIAMQASRPIGPEVLQMLTQIPIIVNKVYMDGWYFFGWLALFVSLLDVQKTKRVIIPAIIYFLLLISSLNKTGEMGWYMIVLFPFMAIASAYILQKSLVKNNWFIIALLTFVGLPQIKLLYEDNFGLTTPVFRVLVGLLFVPFIFALLTRREKLFITLSKLYFYLFILANIFLTYTYVHPA